MPENGKMAKVGSYLASSDYQFSEFGSKAGQALEDNRHGGGPKGAGPAMKAKDAALALVRLFLAITFLCYGLLKVLGGQFIFGDFLLDSRSVDGPTMVWAFYGYSPVYGRLIGVAEMAAGALLLVPRTRALGALLLLPIAANITVLDFCFHFPAVKYFALTLTLLNLVLLAAEYEKLKLLLRLALADEWQVQKVSDVALAEAKGPPDAQGLSASPPPRRPWRALAKYGPLTAGGLLVALFLTNLFVAALSDPVEAAAAYCAGRGWDRQELQMRRWKMTSGWSGFDRRGDVEFAVKGTSPSKVLRVAVRRPHSFTGWQVLDYTEISSPPP
jgi:hypothetical protein